MAKLENNIKEIEYNVLTFENQFVDESKLFDGIYSTSVPRLRDKNETLESIISELEEMQNFWRLEKIDYYIENLKNCEIKKVKVYL